MQEAKSRSGLKPIQTLLTFYEIGETEGTSFIAMEFLDGETFRAACADYLGDLCAPDECDV